MKSFSKFLLYLALTNCYPLYARNIFLIQMQQSLQASQTQERLIKVLKDELLIPEILITKRIGKCHKDKHAIMQICINQSGDATFVVLKKDVLKRSFGIFSLKND